MQARDTGQAMLAQTQVDGALEPSQVPPGVAPTFTLDGQSVDIVKDGLVGYSNSFAELTPGPRNDYPSAFFYDAVYSGWTIDKVIEQTKRAYSDGAGAQDLNTGLGTQIGDTLGTQIGDTGTHPSRERDSSKGS